MSKVDGDLIQSILWYAIAAIWALIAIARWLSGGPDGSDAMTHFGIAFILANIFELRSEMGKRLTKNAGRRIAPIGSAEIWDANTPIWMDAASTLPTARNISVARIITSRRSSMSKEQATEKWVVEVRRAHALEHRPGNWCCVAQCDDGQTAITVADALQNFMRTGLIGDDFHTRTRLVGEKGARRHGI